LKADKHELLFSSGRSFATKGQSEIAEHAVREILHGKMGTCIEGIEMGD
jgi:hypothetical protein